MNSWTAQRPSCDYTYYSDSHYNKKKYIGTKGVYVVFLMQTKRYIISTHTQEDSSKISSIPASMILLLGHHFRLLTIIYWPYM